MRSLSEAMRLRYSRCLSGSVTQPTLISSAKPFIDVSGDFSSCEALATKSVRMRSVRRTSFMSVCSFSMRQATPCSTGCSSSNVSTLRGRPLSSMSSSACMAPVKRAAKRRANSTEPAPSSSASAIMSGSISYSIE